MADSDIERLRDSIDEAWEEARNFGLDPFPTHFELVPASIMYEFDHGKAEVERFLDAVLSIQEHVDYNLLIRENEPDKDKQKEKTVKQLTSNYDDLWGLDKSARKVEEERDRFPGRPPKFPEKPAKDLLQFLANYSPHLTPWQRDIVEIVRTEMLYFVPQMHTTIMNEGSASLWHSRIIRRLAELGVISDSEVIEFAQLHSCELYTS